MTASFNSRNAIAVLIIAGLLLLPVYSQLSGNVFVLTLFTRIVIFALAVLAAIVLWYIVRRTRLGLQMRATVDVLAELSQRSAITGKVHASYAAFRERSAPWSRVSIEAVLRARGA